MKSCKNLTHPPKRYYAASSLLWILSYVLALQVGNTVAFSSPITKVPHFAQNQLVQHVSAGNQDRASTRKKARGKPKGKARRPGYKKKPKEDSRRRQGSSIRPVLGNDYEENTAPATNQHRLCSAINCEHFDDCSGCAVNENVGEINTIQSAKSYFSSPWIRQKTIRRTTTDHDFFRVIIPSPLTVWRTQAKLVAAPKSSAWAKDGNTFGLYRKRTHQVESIPNCSVHHPSVNRAVAVLEEATKKVGNSAYDEERREGGLRYVQLQVERTTGKVCLSLIWNAESLKETQPALSRLVKQLNQLDPDLWHSMWVNCNDGMGNNVIARNPNRWHRISGPEFLREPLPVGDKGWLFFTPLTFRQGNMDGFDILANAVARIVPDGSKVCELYAGVGLLGLTALAYNAENGSGLKWLRCSDENPSNSRCFQRSVDSLPLEWVGKGSDNRKKKEEELTIAELMQRMESGETIQTEEPVGDTAKYMVASAAKALTSGQALGADVIIVDPPRKGLEPEVLDELCKGINKDQDYVEDISMFTTPDHLANWANDAQCLIYVSCGFDALARDAERLLTSNAGWRLESATGYVLFPGSDHVETLCCFRRD